MKTENILIVLCPHRKSLLSEVVLPKSQSFSNISTSTLTFLLPIIFQSLQIAIVYILSRFYDYMQWEGQDKVSLLHIPQTHFLWAQVLGAAAWKAPGTYREELYCLASGWEPGLGGQLSARQKCWQRPLLLFWDSPTCPPPTQARMQTPSRSMHLLPLRCSLGPLD